MKLLRMTATFGRLDHETLTLTDGLNLLQLPNEAGKSTWAEFLLAMFYGIDTSEREKTGVLPVKTKYQPWNGKAMEGTIELEQDGRRITLTRTSAARAPMSVFSAVYTDSGLPVEGLTGANCGERLLGVPKSVYQRSAFVRQAGLGLTPDESLESRLSALVTTGDETVSYAAADKRLQAWQNRVKHNKTGLIPDAERALAAVEENLQTLAGEHQKNLELHAQLQQLQLQKERCEAQLRALEAAEAQQKRKRLYDAKLAALQASNRENAAAAQCARLPQEGTLQTLSQEAAALLRSPEPEKPAPAPEKPACPPAFAGVDEERLMEKAQHDMREFDRLTAKKYRSSALCWIFAIAGLALAAVGWFGLHEILICAVDALIALGCVGLALLHARHNRRREQELDQAQALLTLYGNRSRDEFAVLAADTREALRVWRAACSRAAEDAASYEAAKRLRAERTAALLGSVRMFSDAGTPAAAQAAIAKALAAYGAYHDAQRQAFGELPELPDAPSDPPELTRPQAEAALARTQTLLAAVQSQLDQSRGRLEQFGSEAELTAKKQELGEQLETLNERKAALELARAALEQANTALAARFSPRLVQEASEIFAALTGGRYARVQVDRRMNLEAGEQDAVMHRLLSLSGGTADGLYLAVRLAICRLLRPSCSTTRSPCSTIRGCAWPCSCCSRRRIPARSSCSPARAARRRRWRTEKETAHHRIAPVMGGIFALVRPAQCADGGSSG